jgi:16S rRNA (guanine527-N7)-methyltransferase
VVLTEPGSEQRRLLERYLDELDRWNRRLNLTAVRREQAWGRHVLESIALLDAAEIAAGSRIVDLGSGGGIPGVPAAILRPDLAVTLLDSDRRKAGFLIHVAGLLDLPNVTVVARRAEDAARDPGHHEGYHAVVSRATAPVPLLAELALPLLRPGGCLWALVSDAERDAEALAARGDVRPRAAAPGILAVEKLRRPPATAAPC